LGKLKNRLIHFVLLMSVNQEIRGNTLKIYLYLLKHGPSDLRDIQRGTGLSSASLASYHLGKLMEASLAKQDEYGRYLAVKEKADTVLEGYAKIGKAVVPQMFFFTLFFTITVAFFAVAAYIVPVYSYYLAAICVAMLAVFWYETIKLMKKLSI
jgi:hypothetical protein